MPKKSAVPAPFVYEVVIDPSNGTVIRDGYGNPTYRVKNTMTHLTPVVISTGDLNTLQSFRTDHEAELTQEEKAYLDVRIHTAQRVQELEEQAKKDIYEGKRPSQPAVDLDEQGFYGFSGIKLNGPQSSDNGCWATSLSLMLASRGVDMSQEEIRSFRPEYPEGVLPDSGVMINANIDGPNNPYANADLLLKVLPNSSMQQLQINPIRTSEMRIDGKALTKDEAEIVDDYLRDEMKRKLQEVFAKALVEDHSPVGLCLDGHFVTVTGIREDGTIRFEDSGRGNPNEPYRSTKTMTMDDLVNYYLFDHYKNDGNFKQASGLSLCWMKDLDTPEYEQRQEEKPRVFPADESVVSVDENGDVKVDIPHDHRSITTSGKVSEGFVKGQGLNQTLKLDQTRLSEMLGDRRIENIGPGEYFIGSQETYLPRQVFYLKDPALKPQEIQQEIHQVQEPVIGNNVQVPQVHQVPELQGQQGQQEEEEGERLNYEETFTDLWKTARDPESTPGERQDALASLIAMNGMWMDALGNGTANQGADENELNRKAAQIKESLSFRMLMRDDYDKELCESGDINRIVGELHSKERELAAYTKIAVYRKNGKYFIREKTQNAAVSMIARMADIGGETGAGTYWGGFINRSADKNSPEYTAMMTAVGNYQTNSSPENLYLSVQAVLKYIDGKETVRWSGTGKERWYECMHYLYYAMPRKEFEKVCQRVNEKRGAGIYSKDRVGPEDFYHSKTTVGDIFKATKKRINDGTATDRDYARIVALHELHGNALEDSEEEFYDTNVSDRNGHSMDNLRQTVDEILADQEFLWLLAHKSRRELNNLVREDNGAGLADYKNLVHDMKLQKSVDEFEVIDKADVQPNGPEAGQP